MLNFELIAAMSPHRPTVVMDGPDAAPVSVTRSLYSGLKVQIAVELGDRTAFTRIYEDGVLIHTMNPGNRNYATGRTSVGLISASHFLNGIETEQVFEGGGA